MNEEGEEGRGGRGEEREEQGSLLCDEEEEEAGRESEEGVKLALLSLPESLE